MACVEKIFLPKMAELRADFRRNREIIVDDQANARAPRDRQDGFGHPAHFLGRGIFGAELDQVRAAVAKLLGNPLRLASMQVSGVNERIKPAI